MRDSERLSLLTRVVGALNEAGSWTGRMHIHKLIYFAQKLIGLRSDYEFILYQRGPYSFDLDADIRSVRSLSAVDIIPKPPYGPTYVVTPSGVNLALEAPIDAKEDAKLVQLAHTLGPKAARDLELLATTLYVTTEADYTDDAAIERVITLKPQFNAAQAKEALAQVCAIREASQG
jgi:uncharacterized protein YwgA